MIHYFGEDSGRCGYCGSSDGSVTSGAWAFSLTPHQVPRSASHTTGLSSHPPAVYLHSTPNVRGAP